MPALQGDGSVPVHAFDSGVPENLPDGHWVVMDEDGYYCTMPVSPACMWLVMPGLRGGSHMRSLKDIVRRGRFSGVSQIRTKLIRPELPSA